MGDHALARNTEVETAQIHKYNQGNRRYQCPVILLWEMQHPGKPEKHDAESDDDHWPDSFFEMDVDINGKDKEACADKQHPEECEKENHVTCAQNGCSICTGLAEPNRRGLQEATVESVWHRNRLFFFGCIYHVMPFYAKFNRSEVRPCLCCISGGMNRMIWVLR